MLLASLFCLPAQADPPFVRMEQPITVTSPLTLEEALKLGVARDPNIASYRSQIDQQKLQVDEQWVPHMPTVDLSKSYTRTLFAPPDGLTTLLNSLIPGLIDTSQDTEDDFQLTIQVQTAIATFGRVHWAVQQAELTLKQVRQEYRTQIETVLQNVETNYVQVLLGLDQVEIVEERLAARRSYLETAQALVRAGMVAEFEVVWYQSTVTQAEQDVVDQTNTADLAKAALLISLGADPAQPVDLAALPPIEPPPASMQEGIQQGLARRPELAALRWSVAAGEANVKALALQNAPTLYWQSQYVAQYTPQQFVSPTWTTGLELTVPLFDGGEADLEADQAREAVKQLRQNLISGERQVTQDVAQAYLQMVALWKELQMASRAVAEAKETVDIAFKRYRAGVSDGQELLNTQESYTSARQAEALARANYRLAQIDWRRAISAPYPIALPPEAIVEWEFPEPEMYTPR